MIRAQLRSIVIITSLLIADCAHAFLIDDVTVSPAQPTTTTPVSLIVSMTTHSAPPFLFAPTTAQINGNLITVELFVDSGPLDVISPFVEHVDLGLLSAGTYDHSVRLTPAIQIPFGQDMRLVEGQFRVVPEPSSRLTMAMALLGMSFFGRCRAARPGAAKEKSAG